MRLRRGEDDCTPAITPCRASCHACSTRDHAVIAPTRRHTPVPPTHDEGAHHGRVHRRHSAAHKDHRSPTSTGSRDGRRLPRRCRAGRARRPAAASPPSTAWRSARSATPEPPARTTASGCDRAPASSGRMPGPCRAALRRGGGVSRARRPAPPGAAGAARRAPGAAATVSSSDGRLAGPAAGERAGLAGDQITGRQVPRVQPALVVAVERGRRPRRTGRSPPIRRGGCRAPAGIRLRSTSAWPARRSAR